MPDYATIVYQISTGNIDKKEKLKLLRAYIIGIRSSERRRVADEIIKMDVEQKDGE